MNNTLAIIEPDHITTEGNKAWWVTERGYDVFDNDKIMGHPSGIWGVEGKCKNCDGKGYLVDSLNVPSDMIGQPCSECDTTGRQTFKVKINVPCEYHYQGGTLSDESEPCVCTTVERNVHIIRILPIHDIFEWKHEYGFPCITLPGEALLWVSKANIECKVNLPEAARVDMYAIELELH